MSDIIVTIDGKKYTWDEAEQLGLLPKKQEEQSNITDGRSIEIIVDEDTKSFRLSVDDEEGVDIPKPLLIDIFEVSGYKSIKEIIEEEGVDDEALEELAQKMGLLDEWHYEHDDITCGECMTSEEEHQLNFYLGTYKGQEAQKYECSNEHCDYVEIKTIEEMMKE